MRRPSHDPQPEQSTRASGWRIAYRPSWSPSLPFCVFWNGTALSHFSSFGAAIGHHKIASLNWSDWS